MTVPDPGDCTDEIGGDLNMAKMLFENASRGKFRRNRAYPTHALRISALARPANCDLVLLRN
jgi:hypothetical protein